MADIDVVLERLVTDAAFRDRLGSDPAAALAGYDLTADDLALLASSLDDTDPGQRGVEQRTSKSAVLGLLASLTGGGGGAGELESRPPRLDGASKDAAFFGDAAPGGQTEAAYTKIDHIKGESATGDVPDDATEIRVPGKSKWGDVTLDRATGGGVDLGDVAPGGETEAAYTKLDHIKGEATEAPDDGDTSRAPSGQKKYNNITLKHGSTSAVPDEQFAPADAAGEPDLAFKQGWPTKWQGANAAPTDGDAPAAGAEQGEDDAAWPRKWQGTFATDPTGAGDASTDPGSGSPAPGTEQQQQKDFLTIEDA